MRRRARNRFTQTIFIYPNKNKEKEESQLEDFAPSEAMELFTEAVPLYCSKAGKIGNIRYGHMLSSEYFIFKIWYDNKIIKGYIAKFEEREFIIERIINVDNAYRIMHLIAALRKNKSATNNVYDGYSSS